MMTMIKGPLAAVLLVLSLPAIAAEPVRLVGIYVQPFYESARTPGGSPSESSTTICSVQAGARMSLPRAI